MSKKQKKSQKTLLDLLDVIPDKVRSPLAILMGYPQEVADFLAVQSSPEDISYQMDVYPAEKLREELRDISSAAQVVTAPDFWDIPHPVRTVLYPVPKMGERSLKLDMAEQAFQVLQPGGDLVIVSPYEKELLFPPLLKKLFGKVHIPPEGEGQIFWAQKQADRPRRRHEIAFHVQRPDGPSLHFISRPGVFAYGRFDHGARALVESMEIEPGDRILDFGCGCGTNGIHAGLRSQTGEVVFVDSNLRALALARENAKANGIKYFQTIATSSAEGIPGPFDVVLANPPYFARESIAAKFILRSRELLKSRGKFFLVTKQPQEVSEMVLDSFKDAEVEVRRGYSIFRAVAR